MGGVVQPAGTVTLVFTDIEGSTRLLEELGTDGYRAALAEHRRIVREACSRHSGYEVDYEGDAFFYAFASAQAAVSAVSEAMTGLAEGPIRIRVGMHTGEPALDPPKYVGIDVHRAARIMASAHGGQVVLSPTTVALLGEGVELRELGAHRLKDLTAPIQLAQLVVEGLPSAFPPLKTLYRSNLPVAATPFIGRENELTAVVERLTDPQVRLLTLTGPGGTGKTRLALQAAAQTADHYPDGITWVPLAPVRDPDVAAATIAGAVGASERPDEPLVEAIARALLDKRALVLLDNVEQLLPELAVGLGAIAEACPSSTLLVTSRERLRVRAERVAAVPSMSEGDAERLFLAAARAAGVELAPGEIVRELCRRLDELPLALELAAARTPLLTPGQLLERLGQRLDLLQAGRESDPRHQTLRATIDWSHELLEPEERHLFAQLAVFAGGFTLEAAEAVCAADLDTLQSLVEKTLIRFTPAEIDGRFWMLETIREFARERLEATGGLDAARRSHALCYLDTAERDTDLLYGPERARGLERFEVERENFRLARAWWSAADGAEEELRLVQALGGFWDARGPLGELRSWQDHALARAERAPVMAARPALWVTAAHTAMRLGDHEACERRARRALELARNRSDASYEARALMMLAVAVADSGDVAKGCALGEQAVEVARRCGDARRVALALINLADLALTNGALERAAGAAMEALATDDDVLDPANRAIALINLATAKLGLGDVAGASANVRDALELSSGLGELDVVAQCLDLAAATEDEKLPEAAQLLGAAAGFRHEVEAVAGKATRAVYEAAESRLVESLGATAYRGRVDEGRALSAEAAIFLARTLLSRPLGEHRGSGSPS